MSKNSNLAGQVYTLMKSITVKEVLKLPQLKEGHIFNSLEFQSLKSGKKKYFVLTENDVFISSIIFSLVDKGAISGYGATFGSIDFSSALTQDKLSYFLKEVIEMLKDVGITEVSIKHWPLIYSLHLDLTSILVKQGFSTRQTEINQHLLISDDPFNKRIKYNERKKLNQCLEKGYRFMRLSPDALAPVYDLVANTRDRKGFPVSMSFNELFAAVNRMPERYLLFVLYDDETLIAASVSIRISDRILYNFYHADDLAYRSTSPLVMLVQHIYEYCQKNRIEILDFGVSSEKGVVNDGLFKFKQNLGCETSEKITYQLKDD